MVRRIEAEFDLTTGTAIEADFVVYNAIPVSQANHNDLQGRSEDDAHPISAITGLQDALDELETAIEDETEAREGADTTLQQNITAEASARSLADTTLQQNIDTKVTKNADITAGTHTKITYDSKGLVTSGSDLTESDIPALHLSKISDITANASEVNVLDGITATTQELNYTDGVTSNIQTQLNNKVEKNSAITGATKTKITYDSKGLVTSGSDLVASDIPSIPLLKISDVNVSSPTNGQALVYDNTSSKWVNGTVALNQGTGISIANNTISVADPTLTNQGTGSKSVGVGKESEATQEGTTAVGHDANATSTFGTAVGYASRATNTNTVAIGKEAKATQQRATAIGTLAEATAQDAIQIGGGTNSTANTLQVKSYTLLNTSTGIIPNDRLDTIPYSKLSGVASSAQGGLADTALQPNDLSATSPIAYSNKTISVASGYQIPTNTQVGQIATNTSSIATINGMIPEQAGSSNQLADKQFVNSSIATNTANYISNNGQPFTSVAQLEAYTGTVTNNDYAFVTGLDEQGNTYFDRYKATVSGSTVTWAKEYRLNNSSFTANQWSAINSGITSSDVTLIGTAIQPNDNVSELTNDAGYITGITSSDVTTALGYTPYNATNPNGYQTATQVNTAITGYHDSTKADVNDLGTLAYADAITNGDISGTINQDKITNLTTDLGNKVTKNADITGATKCKITYDSKGLVTAGADLSASDIPNLSLSKITDVTASATELNYCDGVTSNIQTQLNGKQGTLPTLESGKYLTNNGTTLSWASVDALPSQSGQSGKYLKTNGTTASWDAVVSTTITYWD